MVLTAEAPAVFDRPRWWTDLVDDWKASVGNLFILHGGIADYAEYPESNLTVRDYIAVTLSRTFLVVGYSPDEGITFPNDDADGTDRKLFEVALGLSTGDDADALLRGQLGSGPNEDLPKAPDLALPMLATFLRTAPGEPQAGAPAPKRPAIIIDRLDLIAPPADKGTAGPGQLAILSMVHRLGSDQGVFRSGGIGIMLSPTLEEVHSDLRAASSGIRAIRIPPPDFDQRLGFIRRLVESKKLTLAMTENELAGQTAGLYRRHIEDIGLRAAYNGGTVTRDLVTARKKEQMASEYAEVLEVLEPDFGWEVIGGHQYAVDYARTWIVGTLTDPDLAEDAPVGIALLGPPGTGKTLFARALAKETGLNCVLLRSDKIKGSFVGESERRLEKALTGIEALAPCIVFIDEIDQRFRRGERGGGGGGDAVENNIFSRLLEFFGEASHRGRILAVAATNRPDLVDAALFRPGRFDIKIPLLPPDSAEDRIAVIDALVQRFNCGEIDGDDLRTVVDATGEWTQAELEHLVVKARGLARIQKMTYSAALVRALQTMRSSTRDIRKMTMLALAECDDTTLVPERYRNMLGSVAAETVKREAGPAVGSERTMREIDL